MASDRDAARDSVQDKEPASVPFDTRQRDAQALQHTLDATREENRHKEAKLDKWFESVPIIIAGFVVLLGFGAFFAGMVAASWYGSHAEFWAKQGERGAGIATAALGYIFGRGSK